MSHNINFGRKLIVAIPLTTDGSWQQLPGLSSIPWDCVLFFQPSMHVHWSDCKRHSDCDCSITACLRAWQSISWASVVSYFFIWTVTGRYFVFTVAPVHSLYLKPDEVSRSGPPNPVSWKITDHFVFQEEQSIGWVCVEFFYPNIWRDGSSSPCLGEGHKSKFTVTGWKCNWATLFHHQVTEKEEKEKIKQLYHTTQQNEKHRQIFVHIA